MVITLTGANNLLLRHALETLAADFARQHGDLALERLDGEEASFEQLQAAMQSLPFLSTKKMVLLTRPGAQKTFAERIEQLLGSVAETNDIIIIEPKLDKRLSYYKTLKKQTDLREFAELDAAGLARWAAAYAKEQGGSLSAADARALVERGGLNQQLMQHELDKLLSYNPAVTRQTIELLTDAAPQSTIFELLDVAFNGNIARALALYREQRALKVEPQAIIAMLAWQLHVLALIKAGAPRPADAIAREAQLNPFVVRKSQVLARRLTLERIKSLVADLLQLDLRLKTTAIDADEALQLYLLALTTA